MALSLLPTFGLPQSVGFDRNQDYRYTWIRDASFTVYSLLRLGYTKEAGAFMKWVELICQDNKQQTSLRIMYKIDSSRTTEEKTGK